MRLLSEALEQNYCLTGFSCFHNPCQFSDDRYNPDAPANRRMRHALISTAAPLTIWDNSPLPKEVVDARRRARHLPLESQAIRTQLTMPPVQVAERAPPVHKEPPTVQPIPVSESSSSSIAQPQGKRFHVFAGHAWGRDGKNHEHVQLMVNELSRRGVHVWFDEMRLSGDIWRTISDGLKESYIYLAFINTDYLEKIDSAKDRDGTDWCEYEYSAALQSHGKRKTITVACEPALVDPKTWFGPVLTSFGSLLNIDYSDVSMLESAAEKIVQELKYKMRQSGT